MSKLRLDVPLEGVVERDILTLLTNLIHKMLRVNTGARPAAQELKELFNILVDNKPITALNSERFIDFRLKIMNQIQIVMHCT